RTKWMVPDRAPGWPKNPPMSWSVEDGKADSLRFIGPVQIPPQTTWKGPWAPINLSHTAPGSDARLFLTNEGVWCEISYALIRDNAGRRWETRHQKGKKARRIRWYNRSGLHYPVAWQNPIGRRVRVFKARMTEKRKTALD